MDFESIARDIWADFDELVSIDRIYKVNLEERAATAKKVSIACVHQVYMLLDKLDKTPIEDREETISQSLDYWKNIYEHLLNL